MAVLVEGSEARAYASLVAAPAPALRERYGLEVRRHGGAVAVLARTVTTSLNMNRIIGLGVSEPADEGLIDDWSRAYAQHGLSFAVELSPRALPEELPAWLRARRMRRSMATVLHHRRAGPLQAVAEGLRVERADRADRERVADICCEVFRMPEAAHAMISATADLPQWRQWLVIGDSGPVGAALSFVQDGVAWLGWDATLPQARGRGAQSALIAARVSEAAAAGCAHVTTETAVDTPARPEPSFRNYRRLGFEAAYERATCVSLHRPAAASRDAATGQVAA